MRSHQHNRLAADLIIHCMNVSSPPTPLPTAHIPHPSTLLSDSTRSKGSVIKRLVKLSANRITLQDDRP